MDVGIIGSAHPAPEEIPHPSPLSIMQRRRGSSVCSGVSGSCAGLGYEDEEAVGELPAFGAGAGASAGAGAGWGGGYGWNAAGANMPLGGNGGRYRRSSLSVAVTGAGGGFDEDGQDGGVGRR